MRSECNCGRAMNPGSVVCSGCRDRPGPPDPLPCAGGPGLPSFMAPGHERRIATYQERASRCESLFDGGD